MKITSDLHIHSKYSRAVSPQMNLENIAKWAGIKGVDLIGTGDFTHPQWFSEIKKSLEEYSQGVFKLKTQISNIKSQNPALPAGRQNPKLKTNNTIKFLLTTEISSIYKQGGKCRKIHNLVIAPSISTAEKINSELKKRGCNLSSDGRPIIGLSAKDVAEIVLTINKDSLIIPAHIWTPWFSLFGANSGFDSIEQCFGDFSKYIYAVETGLSSDPQMNWNVFDLENRSIVSFSDAHSGEKIGREATVLEVEKLNYGCVAKSLKILKELKCGENKIAYTIEFYPEEGKYHYSGHLKCGVVFSPEDILKRGITCPVCGKGLTVGVVERVAKLEDRDRDRVRVKEDIDNIGIKWIGGKTEGQERTPFIRLVPLKEIISEVLEVGVSSKKVSELYFNLIKEVGSEIGMLTRRGLREVREVGGEKLAEGIKKVRSGDIFISPGYDGQFGVVKIWPSSASPNGELRKGKGGIKIKEQMGLF